MATRDLTETSSAEESASQLGTVAASGPVLKTIRKRGGRVTVGDVAADTGLTFDETERTLRQLLEKRRGHLEVGESGTLVYRFDPRLVQRDAEPLLSRAAAGAWALFAKAFKLWIVLMLVVYFVVFVLLVVAALVASQSREGGRGGGRRIGGRGLGGGRHGFGGFPSFWFWYLFWTPDWRWGRRYYGHRWEQRYGSRTGKPKVPFLVKVFSFVFGPDEPQPSRRQKDRSVVRLIRARRGVLTATELVQHTGLSLQEAEEEMARLMVENEGDVKVSGDGVITYVFPQLMLSAGGRVREKEPDPAWRRLEPPESVTGNDRKSDLIIAGINGFNLLAAGTAPWFIFPRLGLGGWPAWVGLVWIPLLFSLLFFAIPLLRAILVRRRNAQRIRRNVRRVLLGQVFRASLVGDGAQWLSAAQAGRQVKETLGRNPQIDSLLAAQLQAVTGEFDGEIRETPEGDAQYRFPEIRSTFRGADQVRARLTLERQEVGDIVYSSDQTDAQASARDLEAFDRELERQNDLEEYLLAPDRVEYLDDFELVAFDEELQRERSGRA